MKFFLLILLVYFELFASIGSITLLKGQATITRGEKVLQAKLGSKIFEKDKLDTYKKTKLQIVLNDDTTLTLGQNSKYKVDSYNDTQDPHLKMTLFDGLLTTISGKIGKLAPHRFKLKTKTALIGIRGTKWITFVNKSTHHSRCLRGRISIQTAKKTYDIPAGFMLIGKKNVFRKYKTNPRFFDSMIRKIQKNHAVKKVPKITPIQKKPIQQQNNLQSIKSSKVQVKNSTLKTKVQTKNINVSNKASANIGNIKLD